ncbi:MAG: site-specific integrase, partial [Opitutaceae bacterium]|nr:site-specific integrase [Opitutaceae bacterium]
YVAAKKREHEEDQISKPQFRRIEWELKRFHNHFGKCTMAEIKSANITAYLELGHSTLKTFNNRRGVLSTFFKFAFHRGWIVENTILRVPHHRIRTRRGSAVTFTAQQARELMHFAETHEDGRWVPYFAICLFAGVRPGVPDGEITKLRPEHVSLDTGMIHIPATVSKIREPRRITIQPNLEAWLRAYPLDRYPLVVGNFKKRRERFKDRFNLTHDVLRHTFISMFVAKFRSIGEAAIQAGNSESIIRKHYLDLKAPNEAEDFFSILPKKCVHALRDHSVDA